MDAWNGHFPITSATLLWLLEKAEETTAQFSRCERVFFTGCEFWAATAARDLVAHLGANPDQRLRAAREAFSALGAPYIARILILAIVEVSEQHHGKWTPKLVRNLECELLSTGHDVDKLIADYARQRILENCDSGV